MWMSSFRKVSLALVLVTLPLSATVNAAPPDADKTRADIKAAFGFVPGFFNAVPERALPGAWAEMSGLQMNPKTRLSNKVKELIGLAVASQVPCTYCIYAHTEFGKLNGATEAELGEAVTMGALTRHWSTFLNGLLPDEATFKAEIDKVVAFLAGGKKRAAGSGPVASDPLLAEVEGVFGSVPEFIRRFPEAGRMGAWRMMKDVELAEETALDAKTKSLIGIAVAAQIPCRFCLIADKAFAKLGGATDAEIDEAIAMSSIVRFWSTVLNGLQVDRAAFTRDVDRLVKGAKKTAGR